MIEGSSIDWLPAPPHDSLHLDQLEAEFTRRLPLGLESVLRARTPASVGHVEQLAGEHARDLLRRGAETMRARKRRRKSDRDE